MSDNWKRLGTVMAETLDAHDIGKYRLRAEYERLGEPWPGYDKASWVFIVGIGDEIGEKNE